jgi:hypothetical protein
MPEAQPADRSSKSGDDVAAGVVDVAIERARHPIGIDTIA